MEIKTLSEKLSAYRTNRPDEWTMDEFKRDAVKLEAERDEALARLAAMESQDPTYAFRRRGLGPFLTCSFERYAELSQNDQFETKVLFEAPVADKSAARITEQDAREIVDEIMHGIANNLADYGSIYCTGFAEGRAKWILNKLNADREQVPAVAVPDIVEAVAAFVESQTGGEFTPKVIAAAIRGQLKHGDEFKDLCAPSPSHQNAATDAERFCDSHCTWRDHHHDCPSHESEQGGAV